MNTLNKVHNLERQCEALTLAILAMNKRITQLEHLKQPLMTRVWHNIKGLLT